MFQLTNSNYCATIIQIKHFYDLPNLDNLVGVSVMGFQALSTKDIRKGQLYVLFTAETCLSEEFCRQNNLFRDSKLNLDQAKKGYLDENRRVRAIRLKKNVSNALILPISCDITKNTKALILLSLKQLF